MKTLFVEIPGIPKWLNVPAESVEVEDDDFPGVPEGSRIIPFVPSPFGNMRGGTVGTTPQEDDFYLDALSQLNYFQELGG